MIGSTLRLRAHRAHAPCRGDGGPSARPWTGSPLLQTALAPTQSARAALHSRGGTEHDEAKRQGRAKSRAERRGTRDAKRHERRGAHA
eukprot:3736832-Rhodomonas_salina.1